MSPTSAAVTDGVISFSGGTLTFLAGTGVENDVEVWKNSPENDLVIRDTGNILTLAGAAATAICSGAGAEFTCDPATIDRVVLNLGDGNDSGIAYVDDLNTLGLSNVTVNGGGGSDHVEAAVYTANPAMGAVLNGGPGADHLVGAAGNDWFIGGTGTDDMAGGLGVDTADYSAHLSAITVDIDDVADDGLATEDDNVRKDIENVIGGAGNDVITGDEDANALYGGPGADQLKGAAGNDALFGQAGADALAGQDGDDTLRGGRGYDTLAGMAGSDAVYGGPRADTMSGGAAGDSLFGGVGYDTMMGNYGNDFLNSQDLFRDYVYAGPGTDTVNKDWRDRVFGAETVF